MDFIKKTFPHALKACDLRGLIVALLIYILVDFLCGLVIGLLGKLPLVGFVFGFIGWALGVYCALGAIVSILVFLRIVK